MSDSPRLLLISRCPPYPLHLGDRLIVWHLARELRERGVQIDLIAFAQFASDWEGSGAYAEYFRKVTLIDEPPRTPLHYLSRIVRPAQRFPQEADASWSPQMWQTIADHLAKNDYDIVQLFGGIQVYEFAHLLRAYPAVITPYESFSLYLKRKIEQDGGWLNRARRWVAQHYERWMFTPYARCVVLAAPDKAELGRINPALNIEIISNGVDLDFFALQVAPRQEATLLFVGNYDYEPNLDAALYLAQTILPQIQQALPDVRLQLVGNAPPDALLSLQSDAITVTGRVPDVRPYLARCTVFVCPLRLGAGIKNKVLEALAMGAPLVASPVSVDGIDVQAGQDAIIAAPDDIAAETAKLLQDAELRERLSTNGRKLIETRYSWASVAERYLRLYDSLH